MKKTFLSIRLFALSLIFVIFSVFIPGCQKSPINGDLDGQWQVMDVDPAPAATPITERIYYTFSLHTTQLTYYGFGPWTSGNILEFSPGKLVLEYPYALSEDSRAKLAQYGILSNPVTFEILKLDKKSLILRDGDTTVTLRKF